MKSDWAIRVLSGEDRSPIGFALRGLLTTVEPFYAGTMIARNWAYSRRILRSHPLPRPTISIGNITTGGTGKTPIVRWLAEHLIARGMRPAVLMRGYRADKSAGSDERQLLTDALGDRGVVVANPDRIAGAMAALHSLPQPDVFLLDDAFQHRRVKRDLNIALVDATKPFGYGHVLPRGLMREPMSGLRRADAVIITRYDLATSQQLQSAQAQLRRWVDARTIYMARHAVAAARSSSSSLLDPPDVTLDDLCRQRFYAFAGIANPSALESQLASLGEKFAGLEAFADHHAYSADDLARLRSEAASYGAAALLTTEKDWVKIRKLPNVNDGIPIYRIDLQITFGENDEERLLQQILRQIETRRADATIPATPGPWRA